MVEINFAGLWCLYASIASIFVLGLLISQIWNSKRLFNIVCATSSLLVFYLPFFLKWHSSWHFSSVHVLLLSSIVSPVFVLKFLDWGFSREWDELRKVSVKQVAIDCSSYPQCNTSSEKQSSLSTKDIYQGNAMMIVKAVILFFILRIIMRATPEGWFSLSFSSLLPFTWAARYLLLSFILYLAISIVTDTVFAIGGFIWAMPMNSTFPAFPFTSCSIREFWSDRWNIFIKQLLQKTSFVVLPNCLGMSKTMSKTARGLLSFVLSGILHELMFTISTDRISGKNMIFFLLHGLFVTLEILWDRMRKTKQPKSKFVGWVRTIGIIVGTSPFFFDPWIEAGYFVALKKFFT